MHIPFLDLNRQYQSIKEEIDLAIKNTIEKSSFIGGQDVKRFEDNFAKLLGAKHCIGVANGTDAIYIALKMAGIGKGDEVITVANSWISTSEAISQTGATPVFVDIENDYSSIDPSKIIQKISKKTKAIIPVHIFGQPCNMEKIMKVAEENELMVIEDCAQAHLTKISEKFVGNFGIAGTFSFYPGKNLGAYGDAGAILTNDDEFARKCRMFANHGSLTKHHHEIEGINSRLDGIQAAILNVKVKYLSDWTTKRRENAKIYDLKLKNIKQINCPKVRDNGEHSYHLYVIKAEKRDALKQHLEKNGVQTALHYPVILPLLQAYSKFNHAAADFPIAFSHQKKILSLPMSPELNETQIDFIAGLIKQFYS